MFMEKVKTIKVVIEQTFVLPETDGVSLDGRTVEDICQEWFKNYPIWCRHVARESYRVVNMDKVISVEISK